MYAVIIVGLCCAGLLSLLAARSCECANLRAELQLVAAFMTNTVSIGTDMRLVTVALLLWSTVRSFVATAYWQSFVYVAGDEGRARTAVDQTSIWAYGWSAGHRRCLNQEQIHCTGSLRKERHDVLSFADKLNRPIVFCLLAVQPHCIVGSVRCSETWH